MTVPLADPRSIAACVEATRRHIQSSWSTGLCGRNHSKCAQHIIHTATNVRVSENEAVLYTIHVVPATGGMPQQARGSRGTAALTTDRCNLTGRQHRSISRAFPELQGALWLQVLHQHLHRLVVQRLMRHLRHIPRDQPEKVPQRRQQRQLLGVLAAPCRRMAAAAAATTAAAAALLSLLALAVDFVSCGL